MNRDSPNQKYDVIVVGAGAAGMMCALQAGRRGRKTLLLDHWNKVGGKILISGGGRCNFTNTGASALNYVSENPHFCKSALKRFPSESFVQMVQAHEIPFHEKKLGQLFCDTSAQEIVEMLASECDAAGVHLQLGCKVQKTEVSVPGSARFRLTTTSGTFECESLVVATGGLSIPKIGATGWGYELARQFGLNIVRTAPALDGFTWSEQDAVAWGGLAGISLDCLVKCGESGQMAFRENLLFTHAGLSGPVALQASLHWRPGQSIKVDLLPDLKSLDLILSRKQQGSRSTIKNLLCEFLPSRFAERFCEHSFPSTLPLPQLSLKSLEELSHRLHNWEIIPAGTVGYSKAEVTRGGVDTAELSSKTMEAKRVPGLYFIGEVVDVTGWLGGYNFQWAWASGWAAGQVV